MTGKDMLKGIQNLDADLIEEAEFGKFQKSNARSFGKKKLLFILAAALVMGTMTAAAVYTRWSETMQFGNYSGAQPSEQIKKQAEQSGLSVIPIETKDGRKEAISATDNGITVTLTQTVMDQYGGKAIFRIEGLQLEEGQLPWAWCDCSILVNGEKCEQLGMSWGTEFFTGITTDAGGNPIYIRNGEPVTRVGENREFLLDHQLSDGSIEYSVGFSWDGESVFGKEIVFTFTGFGIQGEKKLEHIMTVPGKWELRWMLEGSTEAPRKWTPNAKIGDLPVTLSDAEIGQYSMKLTYHIDEQTYKKYADLDDFWEKNNWDPMPASIRLKDGTDIRFSGRGSRQWDPERHLYTIIRCALDTVLDPSQIVGMSFYSQYELDEQGYPVEKPHYYVPFE